MGSQAIKKGKAIEALYTALQETECKKKSLERELDKLSHSQPTAKDINLCVEQYRHMIDNLETLLQGHARRAQQSLKQIIGEKITLKHNNNGLEALLSAELGAEIEQAFDLSNRTLWCPEEEAHYSIDTATYKSDAVKKS